MHGRTFQGIEELGVQPIGREDVVVLLPVWRSLWPVSD